MKETHKGVTATGILSMRDTQDWTPSLMNKYCQIAFIHIAASLRYSSSVFAASNTSSQNKRE